MKNSLQTLMNGLIDYAGLFPPAKLPLNEAVAEYISHFEDKKKMDIGKIHHTCVPTKRFRRIHSKV